MILNLFVASIWKDPRSPYYLACATIFVGSRRIQVKKTTGTRDRKLAQRIAFEIEDIGQGLKAPHRRIHSLTTSRTYGRVGLSGPP